MGLADITPKRVRAAYLEKGWKPKRFMYGNRRIKCGCGLGVLIAFDDPSEVVLLGHDSNVCRKLEISRNERNGFVRGFDGDPEATGSRQRDSERPAYDLGRACWEAVKDLAEKEVGV